MICLADTDIILKLAACDLLSQTLTVLGVTQKEVFVFKEEALRVYRHDPDVLVQYTEATRKRALEFVRSVRSVYNEIDPEEQNYLLAAGIDTGEQAIFGATREAIEFYVITADRNALRKLAPAPGCGNICTRMEGRVFCLDQILLLLLLQFGHAFIQPMIEPNIACDRAFEEAFAPHVNARDAEVKLRTRIELLRSQTFNLLAP